MKENDWDVLSFIARGKHRENILKLLDKPKTPSRLKKETKLHFNAVSRAIIELEKKGLVKCLNPSQKLSRFYQITTYGKEILKEILKLN
ncbi:ArsR family transcriptional regulator [Candidatus Pacearchaeota archaeon]|nr:ArsR family transcriptional regulator [Candidatus Pacearchaeota archaeon]MBI2057000.1 ArsR family transcriptional regulator [Candidatus Pacearchaeota archaeon]